MGHVIDVSEGLDESSIEEAAETVKSEGLVVYPTETVYGIAADPTSDSAVEKVFEAKKRPVDKPISVAVDSLSMCYWVGKITELEADLIQHFCPGPLTVVVEARQHISDLVISDSGKVGIRYPSHQTSLKLIDSVGGPITSTSANISGNTPPLTVDEALDQVGDSVDVALDGGKVPTGKPSTVVDISNGLKIIREGPVSRRDIGDFLKNKLQVSSL